MPVNLLREERAGRSQSVKKTNLLKPVWGGPDPALLNWAFLEM